MRRSRTSWWFGLLLLGFSLHAIWLTFEEWPFLYRHYGIKLTHETVVFLGCLVWHTALFVIGVLTTLGQTVGLRLFRWMMLCEALFFIFIASLSSIAPQQTDPYDRMIWTSTKGLQLHVLFLLPLCGSLAATRLLHRSRAHENKTGQIDDSAKPASEPRSLRLVTLIGAAVIYIASLFSPVVTGVQIDCGSSFGLLWKQMLSYVFLYDEYAFVWANGYFHLMGYLGWVVMVYIWALPLAALITASSAAAKSSLALSVGILGSLIPLWFWGVAGALQNLTALLALVSWFQLRNNVGRLTISQPTPGTLR